MSEITLQDNLALKKFGLHVPEGQREQVLKQIRVNQALREQFQRIKKSLKTMTDEDSFLQQIKQSHQKISQIPENHKVIHHIQQTFFIRAIDPQQISSLTQRAFFNSFSLERILLKDIQQQESKKKQQKQEPKQPNQKEQVYDVEKSNCICGKIKEKQTEWIQCANQLKCRGSNWYHIQCSGIVDPTNYDLQNFQFICTYCKRTPTEDQQVDLNKRVKKN